MARISLFRGTVVRNQQGDGTHAGHGPPKHPPAARPAVLVTVGFFCAGASCPVGVAA